MIPDEIAEVRNGLYKDRYNDATGAKQTRQFVKLGSRWFLLDSDGSVQEYTANEFADIVQSCAMVYEF